MPELTRTAVQSLANKIELELMDNGRYLDILFKEYAAWVDLHCSVMRLNTMIQRDIYDID